MGEIPHSGKQIRSRIRRLDPPSPAFGLFLAAIALLPFRWLSPLGGLNERAGWADVFVAAAVVAWLWEKRHRRWAELRRSLRPWHAALAAYLLLAAISAALSRDRGGAARDVLLMVELAFIALLAADFGVRRSGRRGIAWAVIVGALMTGVLAVVALSLFYAGVHTSLVGPYGGVLESDRYARVKAGFFSAPLLTSYCIFASAILAMDDAPLKRRARRFAQVALGATALATVSRGVLGFLAALIVRAAHDRGTRRWRLFAIAGVSAAVLAMVTMTVAHVHVDPSRPSTLEIQLPDRENRYRALVTAAETAWRHPVVGIGPGLFPATNYGRSIRAHCTPVNIAATVGIPALLALAFVVAWAWRTRPRPTDLAIWSGLLGLAIDGLGQDIDHFRHVWILLGLALARAGQQPEPPAGDA